MDPDNMPLKEGKILLFNRLICLLECYSEDFLLREPKVEEKFFLVNQCSKAILACCDALLLLKGNTTTVTGRKINVLPGYMRSNLKL